MASERPCDACGRPYTAKRPSSKFCSDTCRVRAHSRGPVAVPSAPASALDEPSALFLATLAELEAVGLAETRLGQQALTLAAKVSSTFDTGSATAAVSKELDRLVDKALASVTKAADPVDEVKARRDALRNRAAAG